MRIRRVFKGATAGLAAALAVMLVNGAALAQTINPQVLRQVQGQLGAGSANQSALDQSRTQSDQGQDDGSGAAVPGRVDTREEQELRRARARQAIGRLYRPSPVEREYRQRLAEPDLRQFGYGLFEAASPSTAAVTGAVSDDYMLGVGDELVVQFQGATSDTVTARVNREGSLVVSSLPPVRAAGRPLGAVRRDLEAATRRVLLGTDVFISLGAVRSATVFVGGEVERPGQYAMTSLADISVALAQAGGVRRSGSLRNVRVVRGGRTIAVDLYGLVGIGSPPSLRLQDGDRVIVPVLGRTVAIAGSVNRPGIYELRDGTSVGTLIDYAGGALRPRGNQISISRIAADGTEQFIRAAGMDTSLMAGDGVQLLAGSAGGATGRVILRGHVNNPGARALNSVPTIRDLLGEVGDLKRETYMPLAVLIRRDEQTSARRFVPVNLVSALRDEPVPLRSEDILYVFNRNDIDFLNRTPLRRVVLGQPNTLTSCQSLDRLEALVNDGQTTRFNVVTRLAFLVERDGQTDVASSGSSLRVANRSSDRLRDEDENGMRQLGARRDEREPRETRQTRETATTARQADTRQSGYAEFDDELVDRNGNRIEPGDRRLGLQSCPAVFEEEPDLLPVLIENAVVIGGAVRRPGAYPVAASVSAETMAAVAEGVLSAASDLSLDISRGAGGAVVPETIADAARPGVMAMTMVRAGDDLRFNAAQPQFEAGAVLLSGEFNRPGLYSIRKGETLSELTARAGGLSPLAYPYGAIFTRASVKQMQQDGLQRTSRELTTALLSLASRSRDSQGGAVVAGQSLIQDLTTFEPSGRMVVEADPRVLEVRPDLDTVLESGDAIVMPKRPNFVLALGDVANPGALQFVTGKSAEAYLRETGGPQSSADRKRTFIVLPDGTSQPLTGRGWGRGYTGVVPPGSTIIVPKNIDPLYKLDLARDVTSIVSGLLTSVATVAILATR
ncbi:SLBB domain-containing protein [Polymorphobacter sp.]|uniref:SLBB domain-containing protein n=1 Tax=Polymorphobacter sp. TaxID=1909290 RepID=UPI003F6E6A8E